MSKTSYEENQDFNGITKFIHGGRYSALLRLVGKLSETITDRPIRALEIGCGPGTAVSTLISNYNVDYTGIDLTPSYIEAAQRYYGDHPNCKFVLADAANPNHYQSNSADIVFALETFEHIPESAVVRIVENVCNIVRPTYFVVTVPAEVGPSIWIKNFGSYLMGYDRMSGNLKQTLMAGFYQLDKIPKHTTYHIGFDWRWLAQTIRHNANIVELSGLPFTWLPRAVSPNILIVAQPD